MEAYALSYPALLIQIFVVMKSSSRGGPHLAMAFPTSSSLPYAWAVSMLRYPFFIASSTQRSVSSGGVWYTP